jgi:hypothetical protein
MTNIWRAAARILAVVLVIAAAFAIRPEMSLAQPSNTDDPHAAIARLGSGAKPLATACTVPAAAWTNNGGRMDLLQTCSGSLIHKYWTSSSGWSSWTNLDGPTASVDSAPGAAGIANGTRLDVFVIDVGHLYQRFLSSAGWSAWFDLGSPPAGIGTAPSATWTSNGNRLDVFVTGNDNHVYQRFWTSTGWSGWFDLL